jgi:cell division protein ZapA (FtsZ GTPase activity inhibitor)
MTEKLSIENAKLKEENKLILSDKVSEIIGLLLLRNDAKNVSEYMDIVAELRDKMRELQDDIRDDLKDEERRDVEYLETKNRRLERNYKVTLFSFYVLFGSWLVLAVKLFLL